MVKLKHILKESDDAFKAIHRNLPDVYVMAWQKPDGTLIPVKYSHPSDAIDHIGGDPRADATVVLWRRGWNRITSGPDKHGMTLFSQNEFTPPNDKQKAELINVAKEKGFVEVVYTSPDDGKPRTIWSQHDVLEESEELTKGGKTFRFYVNTRRNPEIYDRYGDEPEREFREFFSKANKQNLLIAFYEGRIRRFYIKYVDTGFYNDPDGYWDDPVDIDEKGRDFLHKNMTQSDLVHMLNVYIKNFDKKDIDDKWKSSKRQDRIYKTIAIKHGWKTIQGMSEFSGFNEIMEGMAAILLNRYKEFIAGTSMIEVSNIPTHR